MGLIPGTVFRINDGHTIRMGPADMATVALVIPALNEERAIAGVIASVDRRMVDDVIVGDNGSTDRTAQIATDLGARVVTVPRRGYGAACAGALEHLARDVDLVVFADADGSDDLSEIPKLLAPICNREADLVIGSRTLGQAQPGSLSIQQRVGNWLATKLIRILYGHQYTDLGPFRAIRRDLLEQLHMQDRGFGWTAEMQIRSVQLGARVVELPVRYRRRVGKSKISGTLSGATKAGFVILWTIAKCSIRSVSSPSIQVGLKNRR